MDEFVVEVDQEAVRRARATMLRRQTLSGWFSLVGAGVLAGLAVVLSQSAGVAGLLGLVAAILVGFNGVWALLAARRLRAAWAARPVAPVAMRISPGGLRLSIDAAPDSIFLPWPAVQGFHRINRLGEQVLVLDLTPGVTPASPGVTGLDHPDVQRVLARRTQGTRGLRFAARVLRQPPGTIDQALAACTGGRVRVH